MKDLLTQLSTESFDPKTALKNHTLRKFLHLFTEMGSTIGAVILIAILTYISGLNVLYVFVPIYLFQLVMVEVLKILFKKPRPDSHKQKNVFGMRITSGSFPSGHTSNIFTLAFLISNYYSLNFFYILAVFVIAGVIAFSRILLGRHYIIDVAAGALCGLFFSVIGGLILPYVLNIVLPYVS